MTNTRNNIQLIGYCGKTPQLQSTGSGTVYCRLSIATHQYRQTDAGVFRTTQWHKIICWRHQARQACLHIRTGDRVFIEGHLRYRSWVSEEGYERKTAEIWAERLQLLQARDEGQATKQYQTDRDEHVNQFDDSLTV